MATSSVQVMPELWNELNVARDERDRCAQDVEALKHACATGCGKRHVVECPDCYVKVLERMRSRYMDSSDREWFSQRGAFLQEMDDLFADAKQRQVSLRTIEASIESEKEAWYRWVLRRHPGFLEVSNDGPPMEEMRGMLDDPDRSRDELVAMMWQGVGKRNNWSDQVEEFLAKLATVGTDKEAVKKLYTSEFFLERNSNVALKFARPLLDIYTASVDGNKVLDTILTKILQDNQINRSTQPQRDNQIRRLDELRRAKTAVEQKRMRSKVPPVKEELYNLPPCKNCRRGISPDDVISCSLCQVAVQSGISGQLTVYCSDHCYQESQVSSSDQT